MKKKIRVWLVQAVRFGLVGVLNTLVDYCVYALLVLIPFFRQWYLLAQAVGYGCGLLNSLYWNKRWTFAQKERMSRQQLVSFLFVNLAALLVSSGLLYVLREGIDMNLYGAKLLATIGSMGMNFLGNKLIVFREKRSE